MGVGGILHQIEMKKPVSPTISNSSRVIGHGSRVGWYNASNRNEKNLVDQETESPR